MNNTNFTIRAMCGIANSAGALIFDSAASSAVEPHIFEISARALHNVATWFRKRPELIDTVYPDARKANSFGLRQFRFRAFF